MIFDKQGMGWRQSGDEAVSSTRQARGAVTVAIVLLVLCGVVASPRVVCALPERDEFRLSLHAGVSNGYLIAGSRFENATDAFAIALDELDQYGTVSSGNFFGLGAYTELQYGLQKRISLGFRGGAESYFTALLSELNFRFPLLITASFQLLDWLEIQPEIGVTISYRGQTPATGPNLDISLRLRLFDRVDISSGFLYGTLGGFYFAGSVRLFDFFSLPRNPRLISTLGWTGNDKRA